MGHFAAVLSAPMDVVCIYRSSLTAITSVHKTGPTPNTYLDGQIQAYNVKTVNNQVSNVSDKV